MNLIKDYESIKLYIKYAEEDDSTTNTSNTGLTIEPEDCTNTESIKLQGFYLFTDFIDNDTENILYDFFSKEGSNHEQYLML